MNEKNESNLKTGLAQWAKQNSVRPVDFARAMGYTPAYGWSLLRGKANATVDVLGRFVSTYGTQAAGEVLALAGLPNPSVTTLPRPNADMLVVSVVNGCDNSPEAAKLQPVA